MRQTNASPYCAVPADAKPAACSACSPFVGSPGAHPRSTLPPAKCVKSTITVTPEVALQPDAADAPAIVGEPIAGTATAKIAIAAPMIAFTSSSSPRARSTRAPHQHGVSGTIADAVLLATGSVLLAIAGTACTVAKVFGLVLPG
ncbi:MAG: hypothetical protein QOI44_1603 [Actinomycetota bacterium]|nr:hypothetical protein [Actinomycetota bacterium]